jgi:hypothetical protein
MINESFSLRMKRLAPIKRRPPRINGEKRYEVLLTAPPVLLLNAGMIPPADISLCIAVSTFS